MRRIATQLEVEIDLSGASQASVRKDESARLLEFINIIMCYDLLSTKQQRHQRHFVVVVLA